jgi:DNA-binding response OmpR family regulator
VLVRGPRDEDVDTVAAAAGATALRLATTGVSAAVLDLGLPDADGWDVCQVMRANGFPFPVFPVTPAIFRPLITDSPTGSGGSPPEATTICL